MKNYIRPVIEVADQLAEGVYMSSGDSPDPATVGEVMAAAVDGADEFSNNEAGDITGENGTDSSAGDIVAGEGIQGDNGTPDTPADITPDTVEDSTVIETANSSNPDETPSDSPDSGIQESAETLGSMLISCDSKYMNGVWQGPREGSWGGQKLGCKEVWGCQDCPADKGNGCGLQDTNAASLYFHKIGTLMPGWEASGKLPTDSPYGF